ncbi:MAG: hypothetical protein ACK5LJ_05765 [Paracoccus sp. (in: a-proteobacteria)]
MRTYSVDEVGQYLARGFWVGRIGLGPWDHGKEILVNLDGLSRENKVLANRAMDALGISGIRFHPDGKRKKGRAGAEQRRFRSLYMVELPLFCRSGRQSPCECRHRHG